MENKYKKTFLTNVIVRVEFPNPLPIHENLPPILTKAILGLFPKSEPKKMIGKTIKITPENKFEIEDELDRIEWNYYGKNREKHLVITPDSFFITYKEYESFDNLNSEFLAILEKIFEIFPDIQVNRLGLRYINEIVFQHQTDLLNWEKYLDNKLLSLFSVAKDEDKGKIARGMNNLILNYGDMILNFRYGMYNPDMPAPIRKKIFILDYDAYYEDLQDFFEITDNLIRFHDLIEKSFESHIKEELRMIMYGKN